MFDVLKWLCLQLGGSKGLDNKVNEKLSNNTAWVFFNCHIFFLSVAIQTKFNPKDSKFWLSSHQGVFCDVPDYTKSRCTANFE